MAYIPWDAMWHITCTPETELLEIKNQQTRFNLATREDKDGKVVSFLKQCTMRALSDDPYMFSQVAVHSSTSCTHQITVVLAYGIVIVISGIC